MDKLIEDSEILKNLLEEYDNTSVIEIIQKYYPDINFELLEDYYASSDPYLKFSNEELIKLAEHMNYLICKKLDDILIEIKLRNINFDELNPDLINEINELSKFTKIACGQNHTVGISKRGTIVTLGSNLYNQREGSPLGREYIAIACGEDHSVALDKDGYIITWGNNNRQQKKRFSSRRGIYINCMW